MFFFWIFVFCFLFGFFQVSGDSRVMHNSWTVVLFCFFLDFKGGGGDAFLNFFCIHKFLFVIFFSLQAASYEIAAF